MRLADHLAAKRRLYPRPLATMPDILLIDIPPVFASPSLPFGRYYPVIIETDAEYAEMQAFLDLARSRLAPPDLLDRRASALRGDDIVFARYVPPDRTGPGYCSVAGPPTMPQWCRREATFLRAAPIPARSSRRSMTLRMPRLACWTFWDRIARCGWRHCRRSWEQLNAIACGRRSRGDCAVFAQSQPLPTI